VAGVTLVNKLRAILLMEADFNYMNKWVFGYQAINKMYELGYIPGDQYSQKESNAEDAHMDNQLTMDISRQLRHPLATMSADADKCYDRINYIIMSLLLLAIIGSVGPIVAMLHPIQTMKFFQRTARGDSSMFMGGRGRDNPLQGLCQGNGAAPACWLIISLLLMHGYKRKGFGSRILSPISGAIIDFLGEIYVNNTDLIITRLDLVSSADVQDGLREAAGAWSEGLNATGVTINPEKSRWILANYQWDNGQWGYVEQPETPMEIPLPNGSTANIAHGDVNAAMKALGVWSTVSGSDDRHLEENVTGRTGSWISRMRNGHLPTRLGWMAYRFKLWPGIRYGLATLATPLGRAKHMINQENFHSLPFLGVNRNVEREWRTLHRAFGGIGLFSFTTKHTISMINIFIQHYGAGTTLAKKFRASLEALQLELGSAGNPLREDFDERNILATECWMKNFWERLHYFRFEIQLNYPLLAMPCRHDRLLVDMFIEASYRDIYLQGLNRCRLALRLIFLSDITTAYGRFLDVKRLAAPHSSQNHLSTFTFPNEQPSRSNWTTWLQFWTAVTGPGGLLCRPLGEWVGLTHRNWFWFYRPHGDILYCRNEDRIDAYVRLATRRVRSGQTYCRSHVVEAILQPALTATIQKLPGGQVVCGEIGPPLFLLKELNLTFWELLQSIGGEWMWEYVTHEETDMSWLQDAMSNWSLLAVTDGSYDRGRANDVSGSGWILLCTVSRCTLWGSFFEISPKAGAYRGEFLGLVAIHMLALAAARFFHIECVSGKICCDNIVALNQAKKVRQRVRVGIKNSDLHRTVRNLKCSTKMAFRYAHVWAHQDRVTPWSQLSLKAQLNVICDELANGAVARYLSSCTRPLRTGQSNSCQWRQQPLSWTQ
jgi:hypothetical protein